MGQTDGPHHARICVSKRRTSASISNELHASTNDKISRRPIGVGYC